MARATVSPGPSPPEMSRQDERINFSNVTPGNPQQGMKPLFRHEPPAPPAAPACAGLSQPESGRSCDRYILPALCWRSPRPRRKSPLVSWLPARITS